MWELICGICRLETAQGPLEFGPWRRSARARLLADPVAGRALRPLRELVPASGYIPDFLTPPVTGDGLSASLERVRGTPRTRLDRDLSRLAESRRVPNWAGTLGRPGGDGLKALSEALGRSFRALMEPHWPHIRGAVANDVGMRTRALLDGGTQALLDGLRPLARWRAPVLEVDYPVRRDLHLEGRGLLLVPSYFCWRRPTALADPGLDPVLVYPVAKPPLDIAVRSAEDGLERLLGRTRATVLTAVAGPSARTSSEVARAVGISLPSVSYQIGVLRDGGLVASHRDGKYVLHTATSLGQRLIISGGGGTRPGPEAPGGP
ncbi:helix-turn-helix domain-containing protein [Streptomyces sp. NPDC058274]|uniref:winged helix-turn-helix domain-containing protein n=1 Tax=Streptomyces sp. NPDC058274 TaxID=3346416 RepID=UPI0036E8DAB5